MYKKEPDMSNDLFFKQQDAFEKKESVIPPRGDFYFPCFSHVVLNTSRLVTQHALPLIYMNTHIRTNNSTKRTDKKICNVYSLKI